MSVNDQIHSQIVKNLSAVGDWFQEKRQGLNFPVYTSYDIRDAGFKVGVIDANIYPAGFNNICEVDRENAPDLFSKYMKNNYAESIKKILLLTEEHTNNAFYWENVYALQKIITESGYELRIAIPSPMDSPLKVTSINGHELTVYSAARKDSGLHVDGFEPDLVVSNNDFSESYEQWSEGLHLPINPPRELGWYRRKKSSYFEKYNEVVGEFAKLIDLDPWLLQVETKSFSGFDLTEDSQKEKLAKEVSSFFESLQEKHKEHGVDDQPFLMLKNNSGTYGLAVIQVRKPEDILNFNYKSRKKMKAAKGGRDVDEVIIQEGIPSIVVSEGIIAEPAIYMLGCELAGGFLRAHGKKKADESLNSPGAVYKRLCVSDLKVSVEGHPLENVYGWLARLGLLAVARESNEMKVEYLGLKS